MKPLLAKSSKNGQPPVTLLDHSTAALDVAEILFGKPEHPTPLAIAWLRFFKIDLQEFDRFAVNLCFAALFHDTGKANSSFSRAIDSSSFNVSQCIYHERLSGLVLNTPDMKKWITTHPLLDFDLVLIAILGHHLRLHRVSDDDPVQINEDKSFTFFSDHDDLRAMRELATNRIGMPISPFTNMGAKAWSFDPSFPGADAFAMNKAIYDQLNRANKRLKAETSKPQLRMLWAVRAALMVVDAAASGLVREGKPLTEWLRSTFDPAITCDEHYIDRAILEPRIAQLKAAGKWKQWSEFQEDCAKPEKLGQRGLLIAPCGSGKTLAAWRWVQSQVQRRSARHVIFLYPTRATATEGFRDYVSWAPEADAVLMHGTSQFDLDGMFSNPGEVRGNRNYESDSRLFSIGYWPRRVFSATVDQFLAFMQHHYASICLLPVLADSVVVIDEVHSFDSSLFSALKAFLIEFDVPVLCMTASLTQVRREALVGECGLMLYDEKPGDLATNADSPRYTIERVDQERAWQEAVAALKSGQRVIWVVNTVARAQRLAMRFAQIDLAAHRSDQLFVADIDARVYCYHSRFRLDDRVNRHREVIAALHPNQPRALVITTQVCEMSLDIDADLLITEDCPLTSFIQRCGRANRARRPRALPSGRVLIYTPEKQSPYEPDDLLGLSEAIELLSAQKAVSQSDLEIVLEKVPSPPWGGDKIIAFVQSGVFAVAQAESLREVDGFTQPAILDAEAAKYLKAPKNKQPGFVVPAPKASRRPAEPGEFPKLPSYLSIARADDYHPALGLLDSSLTSTGDR